MKEFFENMNFGNMLVAAKEHFQGRENNNGDSSQEAGKILGMGLGIFFLILVIQLVLWIVSIVVASRVNMILGLVAAILPFVLPLPFIPQIVIIIVAMNIKPNEMKPNPLLTKPNSPVIPVVNQFGY